jgi:hypothetical protein
VVFQAMGTGLVLPFTVVYLHEVRGFSLETVGLLLALQAGIGIVMVTPAGALMDRIGAGSSAGSSWTCTGQARSWRSTCSTR